MSKNSILTIALALLLAVVGLAAWAQTTTPGPGQGPHHWQGKGGFGPGHGFMADQLGLTDAQKESAKAIFTAAHQQAETVKPAVQNAHSQLEQAVKSGDSNAIQLASQNLAGVQSQLIAIKANAMAKVYQLLTPDQKAKAEQLKADWKAKMMQRRGAGQGQSQGPSQ
jgi:Spy/CpxP family protein refolding chaperone